MRACCDRHHASECKCDLCAPYLDHNSIEFRRAEVRSKTGIHRDEEARKDYRGSLVSESESEMLALHFGTLNSEFMHGVPTIVHGCYWNPGKCPECETSHWAYELNGCMWGRTHQRKKVKNGHTHRALPDHTNRPSHWWRSAVEQVRRLCHDWFDGS